MIEDSAIPDPIELVDQVREAVNRRDFGAVESLYAPDAVVRGVEAGTFEGAPAIRRLYEDMASSYDEFRGDAEEVVDLGNGVVFGVFTVTCRPIGSSGEFRFRWASVAICANGVVEQELRDVSIDDARALAERLAKERA